jgi:formylmethanofuran dehydrogenase subunit E
MSRRRSASDLLSDNEESTTTRPSRKSRAISSILDEESEESISITHPHSSRKMVTCNCSKCNGNLVDRRTKLAHEIEKDSDGHH